MQTDQIRSTVGVDPATLRAVERVYQAWDAALEAKDVEAAVALYADDVRLESPLVRHLTKSQEGSSMGASDCANSFAWYLRARRPTVVTFAVGSSPTDTG